MTTLQICADSRCGFKAKDVKCPECGQELRARKNLANHFNKMHCSLFFMNQRGATRATGCERVATCSAG